VTTSEYILNFVLIAYVLYSNLGTHELSRSRTLRPVLIAAGVGYGFRSDFPTAGHDVVLEVVGLLAGATLGVVSALLVRVSRTADHRVVTTAGAGFAALWVAAIGGRMLFAYGADHWFSSALADFSRTHQITGSSAWAGAFVLMALAMVVGRVLVTGLQAARFTAPSDVALAA
jgi:hypothetical protein